MSGMRSWFALGVIALGVIGGGVSAQTMASKPRGSSSIPPVARAQSVAAEASRRNQEGNQITQEAPISAAEVVAMYSADAKKAAQFLPGRTVTVQGIVAEVVQNGRVWAVVLLPPTGDVTAGTFFFRYTSKPPVEKGSSVTLNGTFAFRDDKDPKGIVYIVDAIAPPVPTTGPAPRLPGGSPAPALLATPQNFDEAFGGWRFVGAVEDQDGATAVFIHREGRIKYAKRGERLDERVRVLNIKSGRAQLSVDGKQTLIYPS
jgi:hypothetical protein